MSRSHLLLCMMLPILSLIGCRDDGESSSGGGGSGAGRPGNEPAGLGEFVVPPDPESSAVEAVVVQFLKAGRDGDAAAAQAACLPSLAGKLQGMSPRKMDFEVRSITVLSQSAQAVASVSFPDLPEQDRLALMTYTLSRTPGGWRIASFKRKTNWDRPATAPEEGAGS